MSDDLQDLMHRVSAALAEQTDNPVDWSMKPEQEISWIDQEALVRVQLRGFTVTGIELDPSWFETASRTAIETAVRASVNGALRALVEAEIQTAQQSGYETLDVQQKLLGLSEQADQLLTSQLYALREGSM